MIKIKICGMFRTADMNTANELKPDYIGFVFAKSKRQVNRQQAAKLKGLLNPVVKTVGVFVNASLQEIAALVQEGIVDIIQLHGDESPSFCRQLRQRIKNPIIKAIRVKDRSSLRNLEVYTCDYFLLDTFSQISFGGGGQEFDYSLVQNVQLPKPFFLAGGLRPDNIQEAIGKVQPFGVDVSSGVETQGKKDPVKITEFIEKVRKGAKKND